MEETELNIVFELESIIAIIIIVFVMILYVELKERISMALGSIKKKAELGVH